jgi:GR25 family glycosyltransferase involved in LPS biosynthesis
LDVTFINAIPFQANIVQYYKGDSKGNYDDENQHLKDVACFASHIKAIRTFLEQDETVEYGLICEDDILFHNNFHSRFRDLLENLPEKAPILSLTYMISGPINQTFVGKIQR